MNERIKELAVQAKVEHCVSHVRLEEFANLIIQECIYLLETSLPYNPQQKMIKKHFGIEE